jgi:nucleoside phosphorylase
VILPNDRDTIGVEMESYAVARACELSDLQPKCLIIKSVMDKTQFKTDNGKKLAGRTSTKCLEELLRAGIV